MAQTNGAAPNMEAVAAQRRDTLLALRKRKADEEAGHIQPGTNGAEITELVERCFRAFDPKTRQMRRTGIAEGVIDTAENGTFPFLTARSACSASSPVPRQQLTLPFFVFACSGQRFAVVCIG